VYISHQTTEQHPSHRGLRSNTITTIYSLLKIPLLPYFFNQMFAIFFTVTVTHLTYSPKTSSCHGIMHYREQFVLPWSHRSGKVGLDEH
jgi:hypothetical protein